MKKLSSNELRNLWFEFFKTKQHFIVPSESLIPIEDESLLFINSGVATLKNYFSGKQTPPSKRMANSQRAIRTGDIENIGLTARHHTMFEMLGNFSIGDYFKNDAIEYAWEFLTSPNWLNIDKNKLFITIFQGDEKIPFDKQTYKKWRSLGVKRSHIFKLPAKNNFWDMGVGPCGPSSEIFYDRGKTYNKNKAKNLIKKDVENDRFIEIWNIVFSEFNNDGSGNYTNLPQKNIDTGAGLERIASISQDTPTNFEIDLFKPIILKIEEFTKYKYVFNYIPGSLSPEVEKIQSKFKAIADFSRSSIFAISDGVVPSNTGRGYVIRKLIRKALVYARTLNIHKPFIYELVDVVVELMGKDFPNLINKHNLIIEKIKFEEESFFSTINKGIKIFEKEIDFIETKKIPSKLAFMFFETHGLPLELIEEVVKQKHKTLDLKEFNALYENFVKISKAFSKDVEGMKKQDSDFLGIEPTNFIGYQFLETSTTIAAVIHKEGNTLIVLNKTPFYATSGGQEFDKGILKTKTGEVYKIINVTKDANGVFAHHISGEITNLLPRQEVEVIVDKNRRQSLERNHSAVHLMFAALEKVFATNVPQVGSKVEEEFFRFDISIHKKPTEEDLEKVQNLVNTWINDAIESDIQEMDQSKAKALGATFLDGTKYGPIVRVVKFGFAAIDLCGGTHVKNTREIEKAIILGLESKGSGVYRIVGTSGFENISKKLFEINSKTLEQLKTEQEKKYNDLMDLLNSLELQEDKNKLKDVYSHFDNIDKSLETFTYKKKLLEYKDIFNKKIEHFYEIIINLIKNKIYQKDFSTTFLIPPKILSAALTDILSKGNIERERIFIFTNEAILIGVKHYHDEFLNKLDAYLVFLNQKDLFKKINNKNETLILIANIKNLSQDKIDLLKKFLKDNN